MGRFMRIILIVILICAGLVPDCPADTAPGKPNQHQPTALELLGKYTRALDSTGSFISNAETVSLQDFEFDANFDPAHLGTANAINIKGLKLWMRVEFVTDGKRTRRKQYTWGHVDIKGGNVDKARPSYFFCNWDGNEYHCHSSIANNPAKPGVVQIGGLRKDQGATQFCRHSESYVLGYHSDERLDKILRRAGNISLSNKMENVGGSDCYVIKTETANGTISLWIDPEHGYNTAKAETMFKTGNPKPDNVITTTKLENVRFERIDGLWVPMEADTLNQKMFDINGKKGSIRKKSHYKRTGFVLNPDHDTLCSFDNPFVSNTELLEGTQVYKVGDPKNYIWRGGKVVPDEGRPSSRNTTRPKPRRRQGRQPRR